MRYELSDYEWSVIRPMLPNKPRGIPRVDGPAHSQWHLLGPALRRTMARSARRLRSSNDLLQPLRSLEAGWRLGPGHGCVGCRS